MTNLNHQPVSVVFSRTAKAGKEKEFEDLSHKAILAAHTYTGHEGATMIKEGERRYHLVYRFSNHDKLDQWLNSKERNEILRQVNEVTEDSSHIKKLTGFETWFKVPGQSPLKSPPRWKMWLVTLLGAYPLVVLMQAFVIPHIDNWPLLLRSALFPLILLTLMMYVVIPHLTNILKSWLYKDVDSQNKD